MNGLHLSFYTTHAHRHGHTPMGEWLIQQAQALGINGATMYMAAEGFGRHRHLHAAHFFELADQPVEVAMAVSELEASKLFARLREERISLFCVKTPIEFGFTGAAGGLMLSDSPRKTARETVSSEDSGQPNPLADSIKKRDPTETPEAERASIWSAAHA